MKKLVSFLLLLLPVFFTIGLTPVFGETTIKCQSKGRECRSACRWNEESLDPPQGYSWDCSSTQICCNRVLVPPIPPIGPPNDCFEKLDPFKGLPCPPSNPIQCGNTDYCCKLKTSCDIVDSRYGYRDSVLASCPSGRQGINTAIGCVPIDDQNAFVGWILKWAIGIGGGIAFILILIAGFQIMTSSGDPKKLQAGQELLTSAIGGLILLIFSVFVLKIIGVDILQIPGFG